MSASINLVSLNVEISRHLGRVLPFLSRLMPDVVCVQELAERDVAAFSEALGSASAFFVPLYRYVRDGERVMSGEGIFSRLPIENKQISYYRGDSSTIPDCHYGKYETYNNRSCALVMGDVEKEGSVFRIGTTHFTWTPDGDASDLQRQDMQKFLGVLAKAGELVFTGDFNAPRGREIFSMLAETYTDNVPAQYTTSIDGAFHRAGQLPLMVDGLFSTPAYRASDVEMVCGLSDHCAIVANVSRK